MNARLLLMALVAALPSLGRAQDADDMYFTPKKKSQQTTTTTQTRPVYNEPVLRQQDDDTVSCYTGQLRDVDEYNRRSTAPSQGDPDVVVIDTLGMQWVLTKTDTGDYVWLPLEDEEEQAGEDAGSPDYTGSDDYSCSSRLVRFHGYVTPYGALWIDPWYYDSWYYDPWYGWYSPWYGWGWGLGWGIGWGWYGWYGAGWHGGWWP
ncbi:MAG: hypothetical protein LUI09_06795, partial [Prevotellaceae bacterium]|nr:hypothetical protein [Prevotellaceae bacterium]